jgi:hypothetical protein
MRVMDLENINVSWNLQVDTLSKPIMGYSEGSLFCGYGKVTLDRMDWTSHHVDGELL